MNFIARLGSLSVDQLNASDGTLVTQRMYFAPIPHINRHVLGWYRLLLDLKIADVYAVCVFDGGERSLAKQREVISSFDLWFSGPGLMPRQGRAKASRKTNE